MVVGEGKPAGYRAGPGSVGVDGVGNRLAGEGKHHLLGDLHTGLQLGLDGACAQVRRHGDLRQREERYEAAFADLAALRVAVDQELTDFDAPLAGVREVAFFPPMTGG